MLSADPVDLVWLLTSAALVLFMQAGFTALESGLVRTKNSINVAIKNFANLLVAAAIFWLFAFGVIFAPTGGAVIGTSWFLLDSESAPVVAFFLFQLGFIATATTLISGAVAERMRFAGYLAVTVLVAALLYPLFGRWAWGDASLTTQTGGSDGWLRELGFVDFAGSTVVHSMGGWVALAAIILIGARIGRFGPGAAPIRGSNLPLTTLGVFILWVGWFGFNGGSLYGLTSEVPAVILNTTLAAAFGGLTGMALSWFLMGRPDVVAIMNSALAGLVGITASANIMSASAAVVVGIVAAVAMLALEALLVRLQIDDAVGAVPVHLGAGVWGTLAVALLGNPDSFPVASGRLEQLGLQALGAGVCFAWAFGVGFMLLWLLNRVFPLRVNAEGERLGLNIAEHGASTEMVDLVADMTLQRETGDYSRPVRVEPNTEIGQFAAQYNSVLGAIEQRTSSLRLLQRTAAAANEAPTVDEATRTFLAEVCNFTGWPVGHAYVVDRDDPTALRSTGIWELRDPNRFEPLRRVTEEASFRPGTGLPGRALSTAAPVWVASGKAVVAADPGTVRAYLAEPGDSRFPRSDVWHELGLRSGLALPVLAGAEVAAVLEFFSEDATPPDAELLDTMLSVGTQLGRVVERQRSEEERFRALVDNMPAHVHVRDLDGRFVLANRDYEEFYGVRNAEIRGKTLSEAAEMTSIDLKPAVHAQHERDVMAEDRAIQLEWRVVREGREHVFADVKFPVRDGSGSVVAIAGIEVDVTDRERHEAELAELLQRVEMARDAAEEATDAKSRFLASMSHELRTPLNAIIGFTRIVRRNSEEVLDRRQTDNLDKILLSARQLLSLINDILDLSRVEAGQLRVEPRTVDVAALVRECVASVEPLVPAGVELLTRVDDGLDGFSTDPDTLRQILVNLLSNAVKYTEAGSISVSARLDGDSLVADVSDTGIGIAAEHLERIFEEFHQAGQATRASRGGTGLGLSIARRLARALGGEIGVESRLGGGSTFTLRLPASQGAATEVTEATT
jgi:ammonium transporter